MNPGAVLLLLFAGSVGAVSPGTGPSYFTIAADDLASPMGTSVSAEDIDTSRPTIGSISVESL